MPLPSPNKGQQKNDFISSCIASDKMMKEFPDQKQRAAVCYRQWKESKGEIEIDFTEEIKKRNCE